MHLVVSPPATPGATALPLAPFSAGARAFDAGLSLGSNRYDLGTVEHARFDAGWHAAQAVREGEDADIEAEIADDLAASPGMRA